jgi:hypothetical protein
LNEAIIDFMTENDETHYDDSLRAFFRFHVEELGSNNLLGRVLDIVRETSYQNPRRHAEALPEASQITMVRTPFPLGICNALTLPLSFLRLS